MFGCIWGHFITPWNSMQNWPNSCSCNEVAAEFLATKVFDPCHWTLTSCSGVFRNVWVHLGPSRYCVKLGANRAELVQLMKKFVKRSRVRIFRNEGTRSISLNPKLMFWCIWECLGAFGNISLLHETRCKTGRTGAINAKVRATKSSRNFSQWRHPIHAIEP